jgi:threonine/homoserine/homoserine lactone efflux protein
VLCIRRTLAQGRAAGLISGLGAATADALYGSVAAFGLTFIADALIGQQTWLGAFLCYLGIKTFVAKPAEMAASARTTGLAGAYASTFFLTLTNPMTILSFAAIFAGLGLGSGDGGLLTAGLTVLGVFVGSALWWLTLSSGVSLLAGRFNARAMRWVNRLSGVIIAGFGLLALVSLGRAGK